MTAATPPTAPSHAVVQAQAVLTAHITDPVRSAAVLSRAQAIAAIMTPLKVDDDIVMGAWLYPILEAGLLEDAHAAQLVGETVVRIARESVRLKQYAQTGSLSKLSATPAVSVQQAESLRKMLLAIASDARLVFIRLAEQLHMLRQAKQAPAEVRAQLAHETQEVYAPLANRLGIWQLKWELEDLSFRYLNPTAYQRIATWLASKRVDREKYITALQDELAVLLKQAGMHAEITGRPKHIFSIWRKMERKKLSFNEIYDVRAVRILVDTVTECYTALGIVHGHWPYIPGEFDDYIATPKENHYRSLHTAVIGPGKLPVEIQIRTREMHDHAELGVAAHWRYKEGGRGNAAYEQKIAWLRQVLDPHESPAETSTESGSDFLERMRSELFEDRIYALSPRGQVIDLPKGATPLDYAYHVHSDLGHRCRGAKVNDQIVPLTRSLHNGDKVEIITTKQSSPSRDWLVPSLGYLVSPRSRAKVRAWFRKQDQSQNIIQGKQTLERELRRLSVHHITATELLADFSLSTVEQLYRAIGEGDITLMQITAAMQRRAKLSQFATLETTPLERTAKTTHAPPVAAQSISIEGVSDLISNFARCCRPIPPEPIVGYITKGRGVSIHRHDCNSLQRLREKYAQRIIEVTWGQATDQAYPLDINIHAYEHRNLVRDISAVLADCKIHVQSINTQPQRDGITHVNVRIAVQDLATLARVMGRIQALPRIISVQRHGQS